MKKHVLAASLGGQYNGKHKQSSDGGGRVLPHSGAKIGVYKSNVN